VSETLRVLQMHFGKEGGAERFFVNLARAFSERGVTQRFVIRPGRSWDAEIAALGPVIRNNYRYLSVTGYLLNGRVARLCRSWQPHAIVAWQPRAARLVPDYPAAVKLTRLGDFPRHLDNMRSSDAIVVNAPPIGDRCRSLGWRKPVLMISNFARQVEPVPVSRADLGTPGDAFVIAGGGRFVPRKGLDLLIRAAARLPDAWLWLIGDGKERRALEALAAAEGIAARTRFIGWVDEPIHYFAAADVVALPSRHEPLGNIGLEAWQAGVPLVATRSEGPGWYLQDGVNGLMTEIDDLDGFAAALTRLRDDPALAARLVAAGRARRDALFGRDAVTDAYLQVFRGGAAAPGPDRNGAA
jgi:glycosyltransferase involved in cell wall biosynthesis